MTNALTLSTAAWADHLPTLTLGGSDLGAVLGCSPFSDPYTVWARLMGLHPRQPETPAMRRGTLLEPVIVQEYAIKTHRTCTPLNPIRHPKIPYLRATPDRAVYAARIPSPGILEVKCQGTLNFREARLNGIPPSYLLQLQHYMDAYDYTWGAFATLNAEAWDLYAVDVQADLGLMRDVYGRVEHYWQAHVVARVPPPGGPVPDPLPIPMVGADAVRRNDAPFLTAMRDLQMAKDAAKLAEARLDAAKQVVQSLMGADAAVRCALGKVQWQESTRTSVDQDLMAADGLDLGRYVRRSTVRSFYSYF